MCEYTRVECTACLVSSHQTHTHTHIIYVFFSLRRNVCSKPLSKRMEIKSISSRFECVYIYMLTYSIITGGLFVG